MLIKFTKHGKGCARKAAAYLLDDKDHQNNLRAGIEILSGDPLVFSAICEASKHKWKYSSAVIAFAPEDNPTPRQLRQVLNTFEKYAFAGLSPQRYHLFAVLHTDNDGSQHIHILTPRIDLKTERSLNIAPPGHHKYFDPLRDYFNYKYNWARPDDPARMKDTQQPSHIYLKHAALSAGLKKAPLKSIRSQLDEFLKIHISAGLIKNHHDILQALKSIKSITEVSVSKNAKTPYIAIKIEGHDRSIRLKGPFYESEFRIELYLRARTAKSSTTILPAGIRDATTEHSLLSKQAWERVKELYQQRKQYHDRIYSAFKADSGQDTRDNQYSSDKLERGFKNAEELTRCRKQQSRDRENQTTVTKLSVRDRTADRTNATNHPAAVGSTPDPAQRSTSNSKERSEDSVYSYRHSGVISHPALLHLLCRQNALHANAGAWPAQYYYFGSAGRAEKIPFRNPASAKPAFSLPPKREVNNHEQRIKYFITEADREIERAYAAVERTEQAIAAAKCRSDETKQRIENLKRHYRQLLQSLSAEKQPASRGEHAAFQEDYSNSELSAAATILRELAAKFTTAIATAYAAITQKFGFNSHDFSKSAGSDISNGHSRVNHSDTATSVQITAGIPSLTSTDKAALIDIKTRKELQLRNQSVYQKTASHSSDFEM